MCRPEELIVLVIDHNKDMLEETCSVLRSMHLNRLLCADNVSKGIRFLEDESIDIIIANGYSITQNCNIASMLREAAPDKILIIYSAEHSPMIHLKILVSGGLDYVRKDINFQNQLSKKLLTWIDIACKQSKKDFANVKSR